jgi:hypothetical protein
MARCVCSKTLSGKAPGPPEKLKLFGSVVQGEETRALLLGILFSMEAVIVCLFPVGIASTKSVRAVVQEVTTPTKIAFMAAESL